MTPFEIADLLKKEDIRDVNHAFFLLLKEKKVSFVELAKAYTNFLASKVEENSTLITELVYSLAMYKNPDLNMGANGHEDLRMKSNRAIIASRVFKGTPYEQELLMNAETHYNPNEYKESKRKQKPKKK